MTIYQFTMLDEMEQIEAIIPLGTVTGDRYDAGTMGTIDK